MEIIVKSPEGLTQLAQSLLEYAGERKKFFLYGQIGAGKTTFTKALCALLGVEDNVSSPTYSLINEYEYNSSKTGDTCIIYHLDLYRLEHLQEAVDIGIEDILYDNNLCLVEWPELIETVAPDNIVKINIEILDNSSRKVIFL